MRLILKSSISVVLILLFISFSPALQAHKQEEIVVSSPEQIQEEFSKVPCKDDERLSTAQALFEKMGATAEEISIKKYKDVENLIVKRQGSSQDIIVIGAHYDKADVGCGAVDNWTGVVVLAHLYKTIRQFQPKKTVLFVAFGKEEKGLFGSRAMAEEINEEQLTQYCAMINIDSFGLAAPFVLENISSNKLTTLASELAKTMKMPFTTTRIDGATSDSSSFIAKKIPAVTLSGLSNEWLSVIHTRNDQVKKVNPTSVYLGYRLALAMWSRIEDAPCASYR
jgi:hypothetical protein